MGGRDASQPLPTERKTTMNKTTKKTRNPKKIRRSEKRQLSRPLAVEAMLRLYSAAIQADAPLMAEKILNIRGEITLAEAEALVALVNVEAAANGSMNRVVVAR